MSLDIFRSEIQHAVLEQLKLRSSVSISEQTLRNVKITEYRDLLYQTLVINVEAIFNQLKIEAARYPADWWQAVKERWFPQWLLSRYPVEYTSVPRYAVCPHLDSKKDKHIYFLTTNRGV